MSVSANRSARKDVTSSTANPYDGFTEEERAAIREYAKEKKAMRRRGSGDGEDTEAELIAKIAEMPDRDRAMAERIHAIIKATAPVLTPRTWYGMPAYAKGGQVICFFQPSHKFKTRYATLGFSDKANLDEGKMWPSAFALMELNAAVEAKVIALVKKAVS